MADRLKNDFLFIADLFTRAPDSTTWFGPNGPHPISWLTSSVYCQETADFDIDIADQDGQYLESLQFRGVEPGFYRLLAERVGASRARRFRLQFRQAENVISERTLEFRDKE